MVSQPRRRTFLKAMGAAAAFVPAHNWDRHDWGIGAAGPRPPQPGTVPAVPARGGAAGVRRGDGDDASDEIVPGYGKGLVTYVTGDFGGRDLRGRRRGQGHRGLRRRSRLGQKLYVRPTWRELQKRPGRLDPDEYWKLAFAIAKQLRQARRLPRDDERPGHRRAVAARLRARQGADGRARGGVEGRRPGAARYGKVHEEPRYDHPFFQDAFRELNALLAAELDGSPLVEYVDTFMYGFWGEGHTWPFTQQPLPGLPDGGAHLRPHVRDPARALDEGRRSSTNTQPDFSRVGNSELVDRTIRSHNWLRTDTIFIENEQIEAISNRPPWVAAVLEVGMSDGSPESLQIDEGVTLHRQRDRPRDGRRAPTTGRSGTGTESAPRT